MAQISTYIGRFAPSPTGPLHLGSLTSALASWVDARAHQGAWLLRIEDIDPQREQPGASDLIIRSLAAHGLYWDDSIVYQSQRSAAYDAALELLRQMNRLYACTCTRKQLRQLAEKTGDHAYPGTCRHQKHPHGISALRLQTSSERTSFDDANFGQMTENVAETVGDFIVRRRGPFYAYQLAVVVDDAWQGVSHIVRGADLLDNTARQIVLQQALGYPQPEYLHVPLVTSGRQKLSKQSRAEALDDCKPLENLLQSWRYLGQQAPQKNECDNADQFLAFAVSNWKRNRIGNVSIDIQKQNSVATNG
jgi:glutamyl-Q tRNA(Asp) synthetase